MRKKVKQQKVKSLRMITAESAQNAEQFRMIRTNINYASIDKDIKTIAITSAEAGDGKSTTASNLAIVFAESGKRVLLVDADMRKPTIAPSLDIKERSGLSDLLANQDTIIEEYFRDSKIENLTIITSGIKPPNPAELLSSDRMRIVMAEMREKFDIVIFDLPPIGIVTDGQILAGLTDGTILIIRERKTKRNGVLKAKESLVTANAHIIGVVYNAKRDRVKSDYYSYY